MDKGDLVRIRSLQGRFNNNNQYTDHFDRIGVVLSVDTLMSTTTVMVDGVKEKFNTRDLQLVKRSLENKKRLMALSKLKYFPYQIFCDMDGVLVDFEGAASKSLQEALRSPPEGLESLCEAVFNKYGYDIDLTEMKKGREPRPEELKILIGKLFEWDMEWWSNLPFLEEGRKLWNVISRITPSPILLTSPMDHNGGTASAEGKILWVRKNLNDSLGINRWDKTMFFSHNKYEFANYNDNKCVLIDDYLRKVKPFNESGGIGILHKGNCDETLEKLKGIVDDFR